ncbi:hypothetical protein OXB_2995 [Bacillus sp. OxB-1]|uniref:hypothetical protein n=1 Tax=Bacillus sp. (strain OxB-1) TaxID=98228 RepID=UPI0005823660|nr:hypothetical protein [Bacillus sp. OxB-1]BAQ11465.1 hypothetical protein OXB_2995 [Bacillus sp. OxB-1]
MVEQIEMAKVETWVLCLGGWESNEPIFYYNPEEDKFQRQFSGKCAYWSEKHCLEKEKELSLDGLQVVKGTMDIPKEDLINSIMEAFVETGLIKKDMEVN